MAWLVHLLALGSGLAALVHARLVYGCFTWRQFLDSKFSCTDAGLNNYRTEGGQIRYLSHSNSSRRVGHAFRLFTRMDALQIWSCLWWPFFAPSVFYDLQTCIDQLWIERKIETTVDSWSGVYGVWAWYQALHGIQVAADQFEATRRFSVGPVEHLFMLDGPICSYTCAVAVCYFLHWLHSNLRTKTAHTLVLLSPCFWLAIFRVYGHFFASAFASALSYVHRQQLLPSEASSAGLFAVVGNLPWMCYAVLYSCSWLPLPSSPTVRNYAAPMFGLISALYQFALLISERLKHRQFILENVADHEHETHRDSDPI